MADDLVTWLREQIAEDERVAHAAETRLNAWAPDLPPWESARYLGKFGSSFDNFVARHDPRSVLAQCEAHERVLERHRRPRMDDSDESWMEPNSCAGCGVTGDTDLPRADDINDCPELRDMALAYQHRDGYRPEWRA